MCTQYQAYMLDTNVFNDAIDGKISPAAFTGRFLVIGVQADELRYEKRHETDGPPL
jgi:hypothetical protein